MKKISQSQNLTQKTQQKAEPDYVLVNYSLLKNFMKYGTSRMIDGLKLKRMVDVKTRETLMKRKTERDWGKILILIIIGVMAIGISFIMITQFMNYNEATRQLGFCKAELGTCKGDLNACNIMLDTYKKQAEPHVIIPG